MFKLRTMRRLLANSESPLTESHTIVSFGLCWPPDKSLFRISRVKKNELFGHILSYSCGCYFSITKLCLTLWHSRDCNTPYHLPEFAQVHVHWVSNAILPSHPLLPSSLFALNHSPNHGLFYWVCSSHQVARELELQPQHQSFHWIFRVDFL